LNRFHSDGHVSRLAFNGPITVDGRLTRLLSGGEVGWHPFDPFPIGPPSLSALFSLFRPVQFCSTAAV